MKRYEYKEISMRLPVFGEENPSNFERALNHLGKDGWIVTGLSTRMTGSLLWKVPVATAVLQRELEEGATTT